jgi:hypothetical protein
MIKINFSLVRAAVESGAPLPLSSLLTSETYPTPHVRGFVVVIIGHPAAFSYTIRVFI